MRLLFWLTVTLGCAYASIVFFDSASKSASPDYSIQSGGLTLTPTGTKRLGFDGMRDVFGTSDAVAACYNVPELAKSLVLRVQDKFYAMNGNARSSLIGASIQWKGRVAEIIDAPHGTAVSRAVGSMIRMGLEACP